MRKGQPGEVIQDRVPQVVVGLSARARNSRRETAGKAHQSVVPLPLYRLNSQICRPFCGRTFRLISRFISKSHCFRVEHSPKQDIDEIARRSTYTHRRVDRLTQPAVVMVDEPPSSDHFENRPIETNPHSFF